MKRIAYSKLQRMMILCLSFVWCASEEVVARGEYRLGGDGNTWQAALVETGQYLVIDPEGQSVRQVEVAGTPFGAGIDTLIDFAGTAIQARYVDPQVNMVLTDPEADKSKVPMVYAGGEISVSRGGTHGCFFYGQQAPLIKRMVDGDPTTAQFRPFQQDPNRSPGIGKGNPFLDAIVVDFGANVPINRIRFYPRLSRQDDALLIRDLADPAPSVESFGEDSFTDNFLAWYDIRVGDNSVPYQNGPCGRLPGRRWVRKSDPLLDVLESTRENLDEVVDLRFPTRYIRYMTVEPYPLRDWEIAEFEVYGDGFVPKTSYMTQILDFGQPVNWSKIRWSGDLPEGTRVEIRTRTGHTPDPQLYFHENLNGDLEQISRAEYDRIESIVRLPAEYDVSNWSFWSPPYQFVAGLRDSSLAAEGWQDGTPLLSPGPSRYLQLHIQLFATFDATPRIDQLTLQFSESPSAQEVVGEVW
ncbi:MAG: hypothetical protein GKR89_27935, partial [Candidatus Latescibacteria bacterium]|nr:hypothetical protein [Candidatus Latescibacterota bacterium]